jgi:hypothetical protein
MQKHFDCVYQYDNGKVENWSGDITNLINYGSHYEMRIESLSGITILFGKTSMGTFACIPDFNAGCHLAELNNEFYSAKKIAGVINPIDAITIAKALNTLTPVEVGDLYDKSRDH